MADQSPSPGLYTLVATRWRRIRQDGGYDQYWQGDTVELDAREAARLASGPRPAFKLPSEVPDGISLQGPRTESGGEAAVPVDTAVSTKKGR